MSNSQVVPPNDSRAPGGNLVAAPRALPAVREPYGAYGDLGAYTGFASEAPADFGLDLREYLRILRKRKWLILSVIAAFVVLGLVRTLMMTPLYTATVRLQIDRNAAKVVEGGNVTQVEGSDYEFLKTQYELLQSRAITERVANMPIPLAQATAT